MAPHGQEYVSTAPIVWRKWLALPHDPVLKQFNLTHAVRLRKLPEGLVDGVWV